MKDLRSSDRIRLLLTLILAIALALGSLWVLRVMQRGVDDSMPDKPRTDPDYFVEKFKFVKMESTGQVQYAIAGARFTHNPQDSTYEIQLPVIKSLDKKQPPTTIRADRAVAEENNSKIHLFDNVLLNRPASGKNEHFRMKSDYVMAMIDDDVVVTDKPVEIALGSSILTGTGMYINNATREFRLSSKVRGTYLAPRAN